MSDRPYLKASCVVHHKMGDSFVECDVQLVVGVVQVVGAGEGPLEDHTLLAVGHRLGAQRQSVGNVLLVTWVDSGNMGR